MKTMLKMKYNIFLVIFWILVISIVQSIIFRRILKFQDLYELEGNKISLVRLTHPRTSFSMINAPVIPQSCERGYRKDPRGRCRLAW